MYLNTYYCCVFNVNLKEGIVSENNIMITHYTRNPPIYWSLVTTNQNSSSEINLTKNKVYMLLFTCIYINHRFNMEM
jgi:hypothetical protein